MKSVLELIGQTEPKILRLVLEELGYLVEAIINTGDIATFDSDKEAGNLSHEDKILLSRYRIGWLSTILLYFC